MEIGEPEEIGRPSCVQVKESGRSPRSTTHMILARDLAGKPDPREIMRSSIFGGTARRRGGGGGGGGGGEEGKHM